jgi:hypothetical protein
MKPGLSAAGMDSRHAEAIAEALNDNAFDALASKADLRELGAELRAEIKTLELRLIMMIGASAVTIVAVLGALIRLS